MRDFVAQAWKAGAEAEWFNSTDPPVDRLSGWALPVAGLILAAGSSSRMKDQNKLLLDYEGVPLVRYAVSSAAEGGCQGSGRSTPGPRLRRSSTATRPAFH